MNRIKAIALIVAFLLLSGCAKVENAEPEPQNVSMFDVIEKSTYWYVVADRKTGVMYAVSYGNYNRGNFTLLVDAEGKPLIWRGGTNENN